MYWCGARLSEHTTGARLATAEQRREDGVYGRAVAAAGELSLAQVERHGRSSTTSTLAKEIHAASLETCQRLWRSRQQTPEAAEKMGPSESSSSFALRTKRNQFILVYLFNKLIFVSNSDIAEFQGQDGRPGGTSGGEEAD
jgi:hypothetical protein